MFLILQEILSDGNEDVEQEPDEDTSHKKVHRKKTKKKGGRPTQEFKDFGEVLREKRHATLPYHLIGGNLLKSCEFIAKMTVGKYRSKSELTSYRVGGVVVSIGSVRLASLPRIIDDQNVLHVDIFVTQAVFKSVFRPTIDTFDTFCCCGVTGRNYFPKLHISNFICRPIVGHIYEARVTHIAEDFISALILEAISINTPLDGKIGAKLKGKQCLELR
ncbi:unnamed protein product [Angiostrongylus costaricensis]|uniref:DUF663 domain-containing protein n=1 Tax=Angiostrongylus costaricensis TaxID=334426 RepID=A0A0R3PEB1_ANGCS|nr:unnamed protein product [Angiostrongylus costaricensis]